MRLSILTLTLALAGCAGQSVQLRECISYLPPAEYSVVKPRELRGDNFLRTVRVELRANPWEINDDMLKSKLSAWFEARRSAGVMLSSSPDKLVLCERRGRWCGPDLTSLTGDSDATQRRRWTVTEYQSGICVTP